MVEFLPTQGRPKKFTVEEEAEIVDLLKSVAKLGIPFNQHALIKLVKKISVKKGMLCADIIGRFCSDLSNANSKFIAGVDANKSSRNWQRGFLNRHRDLSLRVTSTTNPKKTKEWSTTKASSVSC